MGKLGQLKTSKQKGNNENKDKADSDSTPPSRKVQNKTKREKESFGGWGVEHPEG